jgi:hypothetical protein
MRDQLLDLVQHTFDLGFIELLKITGTEDSTKIYSLAENKSVVINGEFAGPMTDFIGSFGMPNLNKLKIILGLSEYRENAKISVLRRGADQQPEGIEFENSFGDFRNSYRFMMANIVDEQLKTYNFKAPAWTLEFEPSVNAVQRLKMQAQANSEQTVFRTTTEKNNLKFYFGDHSSHAGNFVFESDVSGILKNSWSWPVQHVIGILGLVGNKTLRISDQGLMQITVDSGLAVYNYNILAQTK